jgi:hypothetical protein
MNNQIIRSLSTINDTRSIRYLLNLLFEVGNNIETYETVHISEYAWAAYCYSSNSSKMLEEFENLYPNTIIMSRNDASLNLIEATKSKGYEAIKVHNNGVFSFLKAESLPTYESLFGEYFKYEVTKNLALYPTILSAMSIIRDIYPDFKEVEDSVGVYFGDDERVCAITTSIPFENEENLESKILINDSYANEANIKGMISTLVHEWDHKTSGVGDGDSEGRLFRDLADQKIGYLIYELWRAKNK